ncbi:hypothetical protein ABC347_06925 [Sphingomonas sp. 1P06PA]|uniref:hypothetical protein n=1 Tax=Sphingomonas sp. 1P06PA TaxID=554121 RepID=UPI0039A47DDA
MGEAVLKPVGKARFADKSVRRRTTKIWTDVDGTWKLAERQADDLRRRIGQRTALP